MQNEQTMTPTSDTPPVIEARNLKKYFDQSTNIFDTVFGTSKKVQAVDDVSLELNKNQVQGVIGESGCGKTTLLMTLMGLEDLSSGQITFHGRDTSEFDKSDWKDFRRKVQIIFQDPYNSLNPKHSVREVLNEPLKIHGIEERSDRVTEVLERVELDPPERYIDRLPKQLSGGEKQRVSIARALILEPDVILADEPVSMLDVSTQASILNLLSDLVDELGVSMLYISHDLSTVSYVCDVINVMYLGRIVETAPTLELIQEPEHPYSQALINAIPVPDPFFDRRRTELEGSTPEPVDLGEGCRFRDRCPERMPICETTPLKVERGADREVACHLYYDHQEGQS